jgi:hypothetical protein
LRERHSADGAEHDAGGTEGTRFAEEEASHFETRRRAAQDADQGRATDAGSCCR